MLYLKNQKLTICILSFFFYPVTPGYGTRCPLMIAEILLNLGYNVKVITSIPPKESRVIERYNYRIYYVEQLQPNLTLYRFWTPEMSGEGISKKILVYIWFLIFSHISLFFTGKIDLIVRIGPFPPFIVFPEFILGKVKRAPVLLHVGDLWPDALFSFVKIDALTKKLVQIITLLSYQLASGVITITSSIKNGIIKYGIDRSKIFPVELGVDCDTFRPVTNEGFVNFLSTENKFVVMYSGNYGPAYDFDTLLTAAKLVSEINTDIIFVLRGGGVLESTIKNKALELGLSNVKLLGVVDDLGELVRILNMADIFVLPMSNVNVQETAHPSKVFEYLAVGKPVACCAEGELKILIENNHLGYVVKPKDAQALAMRILDLYKDEQRRKKMGKTGREFVCRNFSYQKMNLKWKKLIKYYIKTSNGFK